jgi:hypothetical protein
VFASPLFDFDENENINAENIWGRQLIFATHENFIIFLVYTEGTRDRCLPKKNMYLKSLLSMYENHKYWQKLFK